MNKRETMHIQEFLKKSKKTSRYRIKSKAFSEKEYDLNKKYSDYKDKLYKYLLNNDI